MPCKCVYTHLEPIHVGQPARSGRQSPAGAKERPAAGEGSNHRGFP